ncbi:MAG: tetratricopeptide repeat protein [Alphaproteobacteria bacterium]|nr:tetratricopeptide repeat protein [Alphaproteobacteria bacterium]
MLSAFFDDLARGKSSIVIGLVVIFVFVGAILYLAMFARGSEGYSRTKRATLMVLAPVVLLAGGGWVYHSYSRYGGIVTAAGTAPIWDRPGPWGESERAAKYADRAQQQLRDGDVDGARLSLESTLDSYRRARNTLGEARTLGMIGDIDRRLGRYDTARAAYGDALALYRKDGNRSGIANTLRGLGELERQAGNRDAAVTVYSEARELYRALSDRQGEANTLLSYAELLRNAGNAADARKVFLDAQRLYRLERDRVGQAFVLLGLADLDRDEGQIEKARSTYDEAREIFRDDRVRFGEALAMLGLGDLEIARKAPNAARPFYTDARMILYRDRVMFGEIQSLIGLSLVERQSNNAVKAVEWSRGANAVAIQARDAVSVVALERLKQQPAAAPPAYMRARYFALR